MCSFPREFWCQNYHHSKGVSNQLSCFCFACCVSVFLKRKIMTSALLFMNYSAFMDLVERCCLYQIRSTLCTSEILWAEFHTISSNVSGSASLRLSNNQHSVGKVYIKIQYSLSVQYKTFTYTSYVITICQLMIWQSKINLVLNIRFNFLKNINTTMLYTHNLDVSVSFAFPTHVNQAVDNLKKHKGRE